MMRLQYWCEQVATQQWAAKTIRWTAIASFSALGLLGTLTGTAQAQEAFGTDAVQFAEDTTVEFEFKESHGAYQATFGVVNLDTGETTPLYVEAKPYDTYGSGQIEPSTGGQNDTGSSGDFLGTVQGGTVRNAQGEASALSEFTFRANSRYAFYLDTVSPTGQTRRSLRSTSNLATLFDGALDAGDRSGVVGTRVAWDDSGLPRPGKDSDFDDFVIEAGGYLVTVPCPPVR